MPTLRNVFTNWRADMPLTQKLRKAIANTWTKIRTRSGCCGNYGEPGC